MVLAATPAGTTPAPDIWIHPEAGINTGSDCTGGVGSPVGCWADQSAGGTNDFIQSTVGARPAYSAGTTINGFPTISFDPAQSHQLGIIGSGLPNGSAADPFSYFLVFAPDTNSTIFLQTGYISGSMRIRNDAAGFLVQTSGNSVTYDGSAAGYDGDDSVPKIISIIKTDDGVGGLAAYYNGISAVTVTDNQLHDSNDFFLPKAGYGGEFEEFILYETNLSSTDKARMESYLALKYGITLVQTSGQSYVSSAGTTIWDKDAVGASTYDNDIAGIGQDDTSLLDLTTSRSQNLDGVITVTAAALDDGDFLVWGNNDGAATWTDTGAPTGYQVLSRQWVAQETSETGSLTISAEVADADFDIPAATTYYLVYDTDADGSLSDETPTAMSAAGTVWSVGSVNLADGALFTLAQESGGGGGGGGGGNPIDYAGGFTETNPGDGEGTGALTGSITATIDSGQTADTFDLADGQYMTAGTHYAVRNVPAGYTTQVLISSSSTVATLTLTGAPSGPHANADDVSNLTWVFTDSAFVSGTYTDLADYVCKVDGAIDYIGTGVVKTISYSGGTLTESTQNDGTSATSLTLTLANDTFAVSGGVMTENTHYTVTNEPDGMSVVVTGTSTTTATVTVTGTATNRDNEDDISNLTIAFQDAAFTGGDASVVANATKSDLAVDFIDVAISYDATTFTESNSNDGTTSDSLTLTLGGAGSTETFVDAATSYITAGNVPVGMTAVFTRDSSTMISFTLTGTAAAHENINDVSNISVTFTADAFAIITTVGNVGAYTRSDISVNFVDAAAPEEESGGGGSGGSSAPASAPSTDVESNPAINSEFIGVLQSIIQAIDTLDGLGVVTKSVLKQLFLVLFFNQSNNVVISNPVTTTTTVTSPASTETSDQQLADLLTVTLDEESILLLGSDQICVPISSSTLREGDAGSEVARLQHYLSALGIYEGSIQGDFNSDTKGSVISFQEEYGLVADGIAGKSTLSKIETTACGSPVANYQSNFLTTAQLDSGVGQCPLITAGTLRPGMRGPAVMRTQSVLATMGLYAADPTGIFDESTTSVVIAFQESQSLAADGVVGTNTKQAITNACTSNL